MRKKIVVPVVCVAVIAAAIGGFFYWRENIRLTPVEEWNMAKYSEPSDFTVTETAEQKIIEDKSAGLMFAVPKDWIATTTPSIFKIDSPKSKERNSIIMDSGCRIIAEIPKIHTNIETLEAEQKIGMWGKHILQQDKITVNNKNALSCIAMSEKLNFYIYIVSIPYHKKIYSMTLITTPEDKDMCSQNFQGILNTIKIQ